MGRLDNAMPSGVDELLLAAGGRAPEDEHHAAGLLVDGFDHLVGERLPASSVMRIGFIPLHRERHVEQQDTLTCPTLEVAVLGGPDAEVRVQFFVNVDEGRRPGDALGYREAQAVGLPRLVVRVLPEDDDPGVRVPGETEGAEHLFLWRVHGVLSALVAKEDLQRFPVGLVALTAQQFMPVIRQ